MALTQVDQGLLGQYAQYTGFKNRIINPGMVIDQRNAGASIGMGAAQPFSADRWRGWNGNASTASGTLQQVTTAPAGFTNSLKFTVVTTQSSNNSNFYSMVWQAIEGYNIADLGWGTAGAGTVTLSFWVQSSLTGSFGGSLVNNTGSSYPFLYTINSANTWEQKTIVIPGPTAGTWLTTNGAGVYVSFSMGSGSTQTGTPNVWNHSSSYYYGATGQTQLYANSGATWYVTGVQLEKGSTATSFDYRPYGTELALCQRYYIKIAATTSGPILGLGAADSSTTSQHFGSLPVPMRSSPTYSFSSVNVSTITGSVYAVTGSNGINSDGLVYRVFFAVGGGGLTATTVPYFARANTTGYVDFSAEL